jgi:hypothetical protein
VALFVVVLLQTEPPPVQAACVDTTTIQNYSGGGRVVCPCFVADERAGVVFDVPSAEYPIEILRVGIGWGSQFGGTPSSLQRSLEIYGAGLPNPGTPIFTLDGPVLNDGAINQFDLEPLVDPVMVPSGPFTVALRFLSANAGNPFAPSVVHDGNGCQAGRNAVYSIPGGWSNACALGINGDWLFYVVYRSCTTVGVEPIDHFRSNVPLALMPLRPNPTADRTTIEFVLDRPGRVRISLRDVAGRQVAAISDADFAAGHHQIHWRYPKTSLSPGFYFVDVAANGRNARRSLVLTR